MNGGAAEAGGAIVNSNTTQHNALAGICCGTAQLTSAATTANRQCLRHCAIATTRCQLPKADHEAVVRCDEAVVRRDQAVVRRAMSCVLQVAAAGQLPFS